MTDATAFPQAVLSQRFGEAIGGRRVRSAVFITFSFDPGFFELQVLPLLFSQSFGQVDKVRLLQLEDALRGIDHLAVCRVGGGARWGWPPSAAQTARTVFP